MASQEIENHRKGAEIYYGDALCREKSVKLLEEMEVPTGVLPPKNIEEIGFNRTTGFIWLKQENQLDHKFRTVGHTVGYDMVVTAFLEKRRLRKMTGVKYKCRLLTLPVTDICVDDKDSRLMTIADEGTGISISQPALGFQHEEPEK